jgi:hypothetical protein
MYVCHAPGCKTIVPPAMFMCKPHWFSLPEAMRAEITATYWHTTPVSTAVTRKHGYGRGQETGAPSREYLDAARRAQQWIAANAAK